MFLFHEKVRSKLTFRGNSQNTDENRNPNMSKRFQMSFKNKGTSEQSDFKVR
jgi:hypothetical protein